MRIEDHSQRESQKARKELETCADQSSAKCYQCGKCFAGCPMAFAMNISPTQVMRLVQLGQIDEIMKHNTIWVCSACETCTTRCPQEVDIARVMDSLRNVAFEKGIDKTEPDVALAHKLFLDNVKRFGRVFEPWLAFVYNMRSGHFLKDVFKGPEMLAKGKMPFVPHTIKGVKHVRRIFANVEKLRAKEQNR